MANNITGTVKTLKLFIALLASILSVFFMASVIVIKQEAGIPIEGTDTVLVIGGFLAGAGIIGMARSFH